MIERADCDRDASSHLLPQGAFGPHTTNHAANRRGVTLVPTGGSSGPTAGAEIRGGRYEIAASGGPLAGQTCRVEVIAMRKTGRRLPIVPGGPPAFDEKINFIPESYNVASKLVATIDAPRGVATLDFDLTQPSK